MTDPTDTAQGKGKEILSKILDWIVNDWWKGYWNFWYNQGADTFDNTRHSVVGLTFGLIILPVYIPLTVIGGILVFTVYFPIIGILYVFGLLIKHILGNTLL